jgi:putative SOS response-associated peptidase YedK
MCNLYSITTNQAAIAALFRVINRYVGNLAPMPGVFPDYPAPVVRNIDTVERLSVSGGGMISKPHQLGRWWGFNLFRVGARRCDARRHLCAGAAGLCWG